MYTIIENDNLPLEAIIQANKPYKDTPATLVKKYGIFAGNPQNTNKPDLSKVASPSTNNPNLEVAYFSSIAVPSLGSSYS